LRNLAPLHESSSGSCNLTALATIIANAPKGSNRPIQPVASPLATYSEAIEICIPAHPTWKLARSRLLHFEFQLARHKLLARAGLFTF